VFSVVGIFVTMAIKPIVGSALQVPLFHGLAEQQMSEIVEHAERVIYQPGEALIQDGDHGDAAILVISGRATQFNALSSTNPYQTIAPGSMVGEMAMLIDTVHHLTVVADEPIKALKFHRPMVEGLMAQHPSLADHFISRIAERLKDLAAEMRAAISNTETQDLIPAEDDPSVLASGRASPSAGAGRLRERPSNPAAVPPASPVN